MTKTFEPNADARISDLEEKVRYLEQERDAAIDQVKKFQAALREKGGEAQPEPSEQEEAGSAHLILETILENVPDGLAICDLSGRITYCSQEGINMSGMTPGEMSGSTPEKRRTGMTLCKPDGTTPADLDEMPLVQVLRTGKPVRNRELLIRHRDGKEIPIRANAAPIRDREGNLVGAIHLWRDISKPKRVEKALAESEERYRTLFTNMTEGFALGEPILDEEGRPKDFRFLEINDAFEKQSGLSTEILGQPASVALPKLEPFWIETYCTVALKGEPVHLEQFNEDTGRWYDVYCYSPGRGLFAILFKDVTESRRVQEMFQESQTKLEAALESITDAVFISDAQGRFINSNRAFATYHRFRNKEECSKTIKECPNILEVFFPDGTPAPAEMWAISRALRGETGTNVEYTLRRRDTRETWVGSYSFAPIRGTDGEITGAIAVGREITEFKRAQEALRRSEEKFRAVFEQAAVGIGRVSFDDARWIDVNEAFCRMLGYSPEEMLATPWPEITHPEDVDLDLVPFRRMAAGELDTYSVEKRFIHKQGHHVWARLTLSLVRNSQGRPDYEVAVIENITERKQFEESLKKAKAAAEEASQAKSEFLANMSHEIRTPMTVFMAAVEHLLQLDRNPERSQLLEMADQSARRLSSLIDDFLDFSRIEAGEVEIEEVHFHLRDFIREVLDMFALSARKKDLQLEMEIDAEVPRMVVGDPDRLGQILINLVGNAIKFTHEGEVRVSVRPHSNVLEFSVADTGIGIPEDKLDLLFQSFSQGDASITRQYGGTGLGLAISKGLVELMGGEISVQSRKREGSVFTFSLPLKPVEQSHPAPIEAPPEAPAEPQLAVRILLAEDDPMIRKMITTMLSRKGWQIDVAETGREALYQWASGNFDLILMDLQMPQMSGLEVTRNIREKEAGREKRTCIIGLTAHALRETRDECLKAGMDRVLSKPFQIKDLYSAIDGCIPG